MQDVTQPFASRQLGPAVVRLLAALLHWPIKRTFVLQGILSLLFTLTTIYALVLKSSAPRWIIAAIAFVPFWPQLFVGLALPDLWYAAVLCIFLLLLARNELLAAACMMFPLMVSRESTSLTLVCFLIAAWKPLRWPGRLLAFAAAAAGSLVVGHITAHNPGNVEHLPQSIYMLGKVPWNFGRNILGLELTSNVFQRCIPPAWQMNFHFGPIRTIGVCGFLPQQPIDGFAAATTTFGLLPLLAAFLWWRSRKSRSAAAPVPPRAVMLRFCLIYGTTSLLISPLLGAWPTRLFGYGWPLCLIAAPLLFGEVSSLYAAALTGKRAWAGLAFLTLHLAACAVGMLIYTVTAVYAGIALYLAGFALLRWWFGPGLKAPKNRDPNPPDRVSTEAPGDPSNMVKLA
jgi:hypothetical protein